MLPCKRPRQRVHPQLLSPKVQIAVSFCREYMAPRHKRTLVVTAEQCVLMSPCYDAVSDTDSGFASLSGD